MQETSSIKQMISSKMVLFLIAISFSACVKGGPDRNADFKALSLKPYGEKVTVWFGPLFSGEYVILRMNGKEIFSGKLKTIDSIGLSEEIVLKPMFKSSFFEICIPEISVYEKIHVNWSKGRLLILSLHEKKLCVEQEPNAYLLE